MRRAFISMLALFAAVSTSLGYNDHRGHNLDSLERVVAEWTPTAQDSASEQELLELNRNYRNLMLGFSALNGEKCIFYARKALTISEPRKWNEANADAFRYIGQCFWGQEKYDSALVYYRKALTAVECMAEGATSPTNPSGYSEKDVDDTRSALYGAIGNLYNMMDSIPTAMNWYAKAGEIFDRYGWDQSNAILYYNIGETWVEQRDLSSAEDAYRKSLQYAKGDSLLTAMAQKGLGRVYMEKGKTWKALDYLHRADEYFSVHEEEELNFRKENFEYMSAALLAQRKQMFVSAIAVALLLALALGIFILSKKLRRSKKVQEEASAILDETLGDLQRAQGSPTPTVLPDISDREQEILDLLAKGYTSPQIAECLSLSPETIKWYRKKLLVKFDVANSAELIARAKENGILVK